MDNDELRHTIVAIEGLLQNTSLDWYLEYDPQDDSYHIDICKEATDNG